jgi:D-erythro-7,8-dihydroneopterin triphosphate epimerase
MSHESRGSSDDLDLIHIRDLMVRGIVGINPDERTNPQDVLINATLWVDTRPAAASDDIADAVNYRTVAKAMIAHVEAGEPMLVERLAAELAAIAFETDDRIRQVEVTVEKPGALSQARSVGVTVRRSGGRSDE